MATINNNGSEAREQSQWSGKGLNDSKGISYRAYFMA